MEHSRNSILSALRVIKSICANVGDNDCGNCPFNMGNYCVIKKEKPQDWKIKDYENEDWKAFWC